tara:strand:- start:7017 stop:7142 length:126 start_codon:yes stop_codon:yes gene_type:complete
MEDLQKLVDHLIDRIEYGNITQEAIINKLHDIKGELINLET